MTGVSLLYLIEKKEDTFLKSHAIRMKRWAVIKKKKKNPDHNYTELLLERIYSMLVTLLYMPANTVSTPEAYGALQCD